MRSPLVTPSFGKKTLPRLDTSRDLPRASIRVPDPPELSISSSWAMIASTARLPDFAVDRVPLFAAAPFLADDARFRVARPRLGASLSARRRTDPDAALRVAALFRGVRGVAD